jgi:hypothetical protein
MKSVIGLPHIHRHRHRGPSTRQQLVRQPINLPERITKRVESQHTHSTPPEHENEDLDTSGSYPVNRKSHGMNRRQNEPLILIRPGKNR